MPDRDVNKPSHHSSDPGCNGRRFPMSITAPTLSISPEKVCFFIEKAHEFDIDDSGANVADEGMIDPTFQELTAFINALTEDEQVDLVALTWLGRGDGDLSDWDDLRKEAARLHNNRTAAYLLGNPMLGDHLEEGLAIFGISSEGMQK
jgi:Protein of unknown function (DUF3775)